MLDDEEVCSAETKSSSSWLSIVGVSVCVCVCWEDAVNFIFYIHVQKTGFCYMQISIHVYTILNPDLHLLYNCNWDQFYDTIIPGPHGIILEWSYVGFIHISITIKPSFVVQRVAITVNSRDYRAGSPRVHKTWPATGKVWIGNWFTIPRISGMHLYRRDWEAGDHAFTAKLTCFCSEAKSVRTPIIHCPVEHCCAMVSTQLQATYIHL